MIGRRMVAAGVVAAAVAVGGVAGALIGFPGSSGASSSPSLSTTAQSSSGKHGGHGRPFFRSGIGADQDLLGAAAKALNLSTQDLLQKLSDGKTTIADIATQQKVDLQTVIDAMDAVAKTDISNLVNNPFPTFPHFHGKGPMGGSGSSGGSGAAGPSVFGGPGGPAMGGLGFGVRGVLNDSIDAVAKALGISSKDLISDLRNGQSIADIAKSKNVDLNTLITTLANDAQSKIDAAVKAGHLPQSLATRIEAGLKQLITNEVNNSHTNGAGRFGGAFGGFGRRGGRGGGPGGPEGGNPMAATPGSSN
jgi:hypothetical protein